MSPVDEKVLISEVTSSSTLDSAFNFVQKASPDVGTNNVSLKALRKKIDWRIIPVMFLCFTMTFLDKVSINFAAVMGLSKDLKLKGNEFSNINTAFFIAFLIAEVANGYILQKIAARKWLGFNVVAWGIATACNGAARNYHTLLVARIFQGLFEATTAPSLMLTSSQYYTRSEQASRFSFWACGIGAGQILGGILSFAFQQVEYGHLAPWRMMFVVLGSVTVALGIATGLALPDSPMTANFLSEEEKVALLLHISENRTGVKNRRPKLSQVRELFFDAQMWLMATICILLTCSSGVIGSYSSTIIERFGYAPKITTLLGMPSGFVSIIGTLIVGVGIRHTSNRWAWLVACCIPGILGGALMSFAPKYNRAALLTGVYLVNAVIPNLIITFQWTMANVAGHTKRAAAAAMIAGSFSIGNIIGPQTFRAQDAPEYHTAKVTVLATQASAAFVTVVLFVYYMWANKRKERRQRGLEREGMRLDAKEEVWGNLTDKENVWFKYVY